MARVLVTSNVKQVRRRVEAARRAAQEAFSATSRQKLANFIAWEGKSILIEETAASIGPNRWKLSGRVFQDKSAHTVDKAWAIVSVTPDQIRFKNPNPIFKFLDQGTQAHGPVRAKRLFIPLRKEVAEAYLAGTLFPDDGRLVIRTERKKAKAVAVSKHVRALAGQGKMRALEWGKDFVLAKWVKGIDARNILDKAVPKVEAMAVREIKAFADEAKEKIGKAWRG